MLKFFYFLFAVVTSVVFIEIAFYFIDSIVRKVIKKVWGDHK